MIFLKTFAMNISRNFYQSPARPALPGLLPILVCALCAAVLPAKALPVAGSFVEGLQGFIPVDTRVDSSFGTPTAGITYVLGYGTNVNSAILRKYDRSGAELTFGTNVATALVELNLSGITPKGLAVGLTNLYIVGGGTVFSIDPLTGNKTGGVTNAALAGSASLSFQSVCYYSNVLYVCGNYKSTVGNTVFGKPAIPRGNQAGIIIKLSASNLGNSALGVLTYGNGDSTSFNTANSIVVDDSGDIYVGGHLDTGTFTSDVVTSGQFGLNYRHQPSGNINSLTDAENFLASNPVDTGTASQAYTSSIGEDDIWRVKGVFYVPTSGQVTFSSQVDDGSRLIVDGQYILDTYDWTKTYNYTQLLVAGFHSIDWLTFNRGGPGNADLRANGGGLSSAATLKPADFTAYQNLGYVLKFDGNLGFLRSAYFTGSAYGIGGDIHELTYAQGWVYAIGDWQLYENPGTYGTGSDRSVADSKDIDVLKLDTGLQARGRATVKGVANNTGYSITADDVGNAYITGSYGAQSVSFFGADDPTNHPAFLLSSTKASLFVAQLDANFNFQWVNKATDPQPNFDFNDQPRVRWNTALQRLFWTGYFDGTLNMGNPTTLRTLNGPEGFVAVLDPSGLFTERVNLTVLSDYGKSGSQIKPFGGPALNTNSVASVGINTKPVIKGAQVTVSVPNYIYRNLTNGDLDTQTDTLAETRIGCTGYAVDENVANGTANSYTFTISKDTIVKFNWLVEHALRIEDDFIGTIGLDTDPLNQIAGLHSEAAGTPVPAVQKHWIAENEPVIASIDKAVDDQDYLARGLPVRYVVTGYTGYGPVINGLTTNFIAFTGNELRQQVPQFLMTSPAGIKYKWKLKIGVQVNTTGFKSAGYPLVKVIGDPGSALPPVQTDGVGAGTFYYDENTALEVGTLKNKGTTQLKGWFNGDGTIFPSTGVLNDLVSSFSNGVYVSKSIVQLKRPARVMWDYGDRIFEETVYIGNSVTFATVDDTNVYASLRRDLAPERLDVISSPAGSSAADMATWDAAGKKYYPLRPGTVYSYWFTRGDPAERVIVKLTIKYPVVAHYRHIANTPPVLLDPSTNDLVAFKALKYSEATTGAAVDGDNKFTATGPGKTVLLFGETSSPGRGGVIETLRVRVVETKNWNDQLPATQTAVIGQKITSGYDTAGLGTGFLFFKNTRYNASTYNRDSVSGQIIPVNLFPSAGADEQLVVVWYENRDKILWPYQPVRYQPAWPVDASQGLGRIVIASRFGSESVATDGTDQLVVPAETIGTNSYPEEDALNPARFQQVQIYNQPNRSLPGYNPNEEHALLAPSLRSADISPRPMAAYALRAGDLNVTTRDASYTSDPYVLVQFYDSVDQEYKMKVYNIARTASNYDLGDLSYEYLFEQEMSAGEPVIPFYPLPQVIGATPCSGSYGRDGQPNVQLCYWKDHKGTAWAVSGNSFFSGYYFYPLLPDFWWPAADHKQPGDCIAFLPDVPAFAGDSFANIDYTRNDQTPAAQGIFYTTSWPQNVPILKVGETLTFPGGEYSLDHPTTTVTTDAGDIVTKATEGLPGVVGFAAGQIVFDTMNPVMNDQLNFTKYTARIYPALEERTISLAVSDFPDALQPANKRTTVKNGVYVFNELPSSLQKRVFYDPIRGKIGIKGFLNDKAIGDATLTASPPAVYVLEPSILTLAEKQTLDGTAATSPFADLAGTTFATAMDALYNLSRNPNALDQGGNGVDAAYRVGLEQKVKVDPATGVPLTTTTGGIVSLQRDKTKAAPLQALGPGLAMTANPNFLDPNNAVQISYVTVAENNSDALGGTPVVLHIVKVDKTQRYRGSIKTILSDNVFDENIVLRHTGDFGGNADDLVFEWWYRAEDGTEALVPDRQPSPTPWKLFADPSGNLGLGFFQLTLKGNPSAPEVLLGDTMFYLRYRHKNEVTDGVNWEVQQPNGERRCVLNDCKPGIPYDWAGAGNSSVLDVNGDGQPDYQPQLAEGWIKRVMSRINPYEARINDFSVDNPATYSSMIQQLGAAYVGPVALNPDKNVIENVGLIALYETIFKRGKDLSIDLSTPISTPSIANALQLASTRLADFYMLLGNEAYSDAQNPTIGFGSDSVEYGNLAPSIFAFQNQMSSLLEQELALLRGVDAFNGPPVNNRLYWNFSHAEGEAAYAMKYNIADVNADGFIDVDDAMILFPQGHGDAWGHYLSALTFTYDLLRHPYFNWVSRSEYINSQDVVIRVDYLDERKFAQAAAAKAQAGAEIVNQTYREKFVTDPNGQWQGYTDTDQNRSWGVEEWARRAGQGTYFDWVTANALLPAVHPNTNYVGIQKVDRTTVQDIAVVAANLTAIQTTMEQVNAGNNPLGLANGALSFDLDPTQGQNLFDQVYTRAVAALNNAKVTFDNANQFNNMIRQVANSSADFQKSVTEQDLSYRNQLIEIYGTPYEGTIGSGKAFPAGYQGPDTMLYMYVAVNNINDSTVPQPPAAYYQNYLSEITGSQAHFINGVGVISGVPDSWKTRYGLTFLDPAQITNSINYTDFTDLTGNPVVNTLDNMNLPIMAAGYTYVAPASWGIRTSPGELQSLVSQMVQAQADLNAAISDWDGVQSSMLQSLQAINAKFDNNKYQRDLMKGQIAMDVALDTTKLVLTTTVKVIAAAAAAAEGAVKAAADAVPQNLPTGGLAISPGDALAPVKSALEIAAEVTKAVQDTFTIPLETIADGTDIAKSLGDAIIALEQDGGDRDLDMIQNLQELQGNAGNEAGARVTVFKQIQVLRQLSDQYLAKVAAGKRLIEQRTAFNKRVAAQTQQNRYQDITFRVARNAALEKYRSAFDLAARYAYLAGTAYDYDTNLRSDDAGSPNSILADIVRQRTLGLVDGSGQPQVGAKGLAEDLATLKANYDVLKTRLGINNPQLESASFSLRSEAFRILNATNSDAAWQQTLRSAGIYKDDLWQVPEFRRYCRPFAALTNGAQPGLVIPFSTKIVTGKNFFGWPLGGGDSSYDPSVFATRISSVSVAFAGYDTANLPQTPRVYLIPVGSDVMTVPNSPDLSVRTWNVVEQTIPLPYPNIAANLNSPTWKPLTDSLNGKFAAQKQFSSFRAYGFDSTSLSAADLATVGYDSRLVGRSAWNTKWLLVIPGTTLNASATNGLNLFINSVKDIKLNINTHGYSGN